MAELAQTKVESTSRVPVKVFGTVHANFFANSANANWLDNPNLVSPTPADGHAGTTSATLRQTRLGLTVDAPRIGSVRTNAVVAMDFFGGIPGFQTGQVMGLPRLLVASHGWKARNGVGGADHDSRPARSDSLAAFAFPLLFRSGNLYLRSCARVERELVLAQRHGRHRGANRRRFTGSDYLLVRRLRRRTISPSGSAGAHRIYDGRAGAPRADSGPLRTGWERQHEPREAGRVLSTSRRAMIPSAWGRGLRRRQYRRVRRRAGARRPECRRLTEVQLFPSSRVSLTTGVGPTTSATAGDSRWPAEKIARLRQHHLLADPRGTGIIRVPLAQDARGESRAAEPSLRLGTGSYVLVSAMQIRVAAFSIALCVAAVAHLDAGTVTGVVRTVTREGAAPATATVYAEPIDTVAPRAPRRATLGQKNKTFQPRVLAVPVGSTVEFPNNDSIFHNVFSLSAPQPFDLGLYRAGESRSYVYRSGASTAFCNIHPQMTAVIFVAPSGFTTVAASDGRFTLDLSPGRYRLTAVSERASPASAEITTTEGASTVPELTLGESAWVFAQHRNKFGKDYPAAAYQQR